MPALLPRGSSRPNYGGAASAMSGLEPGAIVGIVFVVMVVIFVAAYVIQYRSAKKSGKPVSHGHIVCNSLLYAIGIGFIMQLCGCCASDDAGAAADTVPIQPAMQQPPQWQPQMNWEPVQSAAQDPVQ